MRKNGETQVLCRTAHKSSGKKRNQESGPDGMGNSNEKRQVKILTFLLALY